MTSDEHDETARASGPEAQIPKAPGERIPEGEPYSPLNEERGATEKVDKQDEQTDESPSRDGEAPDELEPYSPVTKNPGREADAADPYSPPSGTP